MEGKFTESERHYISLLQENISRMSRNSAGCKTWLVTLLTAILALRLANDALKGIMWVALGVVVLFYGLDSYYLGLERKFILLENKFVKSVKARSDEDVIEVIYSFNVKAITDKYATTWRALVSKSTLPFYLVIFFAIIAGCLWL